MQAFGVLGTAIVFAMLAMLLAIFLQPQLDRVAQAIVAEPIIAGGIGLLTTLVSPIALVILVVILVLTLILIPVAILAVHDMGNSNRAGLAVRHHWPRHGNRRTIYQGHPSNLGARAFSWFWNVPIDVRGRRVWHDPVHRLDP